MEPQPNTTMKKALLFSGAIFVAIVVLVFFFIRSFSNQGPVSQPVPNTTPEFPSQENGKIQYRQVNGTVISVDDVRNDSDTENIGSGNYVIEEPGKNAKDSSYEIVFFENDKSYLITLYGLPLGQSRLKAEAELTARLGVEKNDLCSLPIRVGTPVSISVEYSGRELGLSFCPQSVVLP